ncbi:uncharacterized protein LOC130452739 [Diorhabda sublineata]|uniref:uncharacterized protein LOC130452739 n=1 Tax=Diorhabda sublineata TaxID=1163346 RepID=UPI0024E137DA|nr:uncharacterized protein LOC130452739 [Diorhabda sublineata]
MEEFKGDDTSENNNIKKEVDVSLLYPDVIFKETNEVINTKNEELVNDNIDGDPVDYTITGFDEAIFQLTPEEIKIKKKYFKWGNRIQNTRIECTSCCKHLSNALTEFKNVFVHPILSVIICKECFDFYMNGTFSIDMDGMEMYCRWCGQGGQVFCCNKCPKVFCKICIKNNVSSKQFTTIRDSEYWECFACNPKPIMRLKIQCYELVKYVQRKLTRLDNEHNDKKRKSTTFTENKTSKKNKLSENHVEDEAIKISDTKEETENATSSKKTFAPDEELSLEKENLNPVPLNTTSLPPKRDPLPSASINLHKPTIYVPISKLTLSRPAQLNPPLIPRAIYTNNSVGTPAAGVQSTPIVTSATPRQAVINHAISRVISRRVVGAHNHHIYYVAYPNNEMTGTNRINANTPGSDTYGTRQDNTNSTPAEQESKVQQLTQRGDFLKKLGEINQSLFLSALASSSCATSTLNIYQAYNKMTSFNEMLQVYNSFEKSLKTMTESLIHIRSQLIVNNISTSGLNKK